MDTLRVAWQVIRDAAVTVWQQYPAVLIGVVGAVVVVALLTWLIVAVVRRRRAAHVPSRAQRIGDALYRDRTVLDDLHLLGTDAESNGHGADLTGALANLEERGALVDLDADPRADLDPGQVVVASGTLVPLPATRAAELLELSAPLLARAGTQPDPDGPTDTATVTRPRTDLNNAPVVVALDHDASNRRLLMLLRRPELDEGALSLEPVTVVAVVDHALERRDTLGPDEYLRGYLSDDGRELLDGRSLTDIIGSLSDVTGDQLSRKELGFKGPGAQVRVASIHR